MENLVGGLLLVFTAAVSRAQDASSVPEPETLALVAGAGAVWAVVHWLRRK